MDDAVANGDWPLLDAPRGLKRGAPILATITGNTATFLRTVDPKRALMERTLARWGVDEEFPPAIEQAAREVSYDLDGPAFRDRRDLREVPTLTIDGANSRDLDDALAVLPAQDDGAIRVLVSIADVDACVPEGSPLDLEARARGTTVYLADGVFPMIPRTLSEDRLSLLPGVDRAALTVELRIDPDGEVTAADPWLSLIRNHSRLTYAGAAAFLDHDDPSEVPEAAQSTLRWLRA
ncbi:MAG: RNB domain-containing ribonuclease, partial [Planctomycetes bacterium]|nr:RNB domain-containing ribonuclease [Planctomycetota bacterium]